MPNTGHNVSELPHVGERIAARRVKLGKTPTQMATEVGISLSGYTRIEGSKQLPGLFIYKQICKALEISPGQLLENENDLRSKQAKRTRRIPHQAQA